MPGASSTIRRRCSRGSSWRCCIIGITQFSRLSINNIWDGLFYVVVLGCLWSGWREEKRIYYIIGGLALGFSQFFYASSRVLVAVVVFYVVGLAILRMAAL